MTSRLTRSRLSGLIMGYSYSQAIACVASLEIADKLADGPRTAEQLASLTGCSAVHLERLMRALCRIAVFGESEAGFSLTPLSQHLRRDGEGSLWDLAVFHGDEMYRAFGKLPQNVRSGTPGWDAAIGASIWDYLSMHPDRGALFDRLMRMNHEDDVHEMVGAYDFSAARVVDVGGGDGSFLREILAANRSSSGILLDAPDVVQRARESEVWREAASRCQFVPGDFFADVPPGGDIYVLRHVLHDWDDERCVRLLRRCRDAMREDARLLVIESVLDTAGQPSWVAFSDLNMMVIGGRERTSDDYDRLLSLADLVPLRTIPTGGHISLIEARRN